VNSQVRTVKLSVSRLWGRDLINDAMTTNEAMTKLNEYSANIHPFAQWSNFEIIEQQLLLLVEPGKCAKGEVVQSEK